VVRKIVPVLGAVAGILALAIGALPKVWAGMGRGRGLHPDLPADLVKNTPKGNSSIPYKDTQADMCARARRCSVPTAAAVPWPAAPAAACARRCTTTSGSMAAMTTRFPAGDPGHRRPAKPGLFAQGPRKRVGPMPPFGRHHQERGRPVEDIRFVRFITAVIRTISSGTPPTVGLRESGYAAAHIAINAKNRVRLFA